MSDLPDRGGVSFGALWEGVRMALDVLRTNRLRALLTILGVGIGVSVVVTFGALVSGVRSSLVDVVESAGPNNFYVVRFDFTEVMLAGSEGSRVRWWERPEITAAEAEAVERLPDVREALFNFGFSTSLSYEGTELSGVTGQAYSSGWPAYSDGEFVAGRDFTPGEVREGTSVVVISSEIAENLFGQRDPIGRRIRASSVRGSAREEFRVVGVYKLAPNLFSDQVGRVITFPHTTAVRRLRAPDNQAQILVVPEEGTEIEDVKNSVAAELRQLRRLGPRDEDGFALLQSQQILSAFDQLTRVLFLVMLALSSAGLMVGGVGVIGIMLISVTERTREIGVRKALGATRREILWQFLVESGMLTTFGGAAGLIMGFGLALVVSALTPVPARIPFGSVVAALVGAALTGVVFGMLPAWRASRLDPVVALRAE